MKTRQFIFSVLATVLMLPLTVTADVTIPPAPLLGGSGTFDIWKVTVRFMEYIIWPIFVAVSILMFLVSGILFLTSRGDPAKVKTAKASFVWGLIGVAVAILAFSIPYIIATVLGLT